LPGAGLASQNPRSDHPLSPAAALVLIAGLERHYVVTALLADRCWANVFHCLECGRSAVTLLPRRCHGDVVAFNTATSLGGGIYNDIDGSLILDTSPVNGNSVSSGGGIYNLGTVTVNQGGMGGNKALSYGGGIFNAGNLTFYGPSQVNSNTAGIDGGGIYNCGGTINGVAIVFKNLPNGIVDCS
jgi:hypothetical protein